MGWEQQMQYRHQYTTDGRCDMAWQPTIVWRNDPPSSKAAPSGSKRFSDGDALIAIAAFIVAAMAYNAVSGLGAFHHLPHVVKDVTLIVACLSSFLGTVAVLGLKAVQNMIEIIVALSTMVLLLDVAYFIIK
jgi:hypothetical protein